MKNFIEGYVNALTSEECAKIISYMNKEARLTPGRVKEPNTGKDIVIKEYKDSLDVKMNFREKGEINEILLNSLTKCISLYTRKHPQMNNIDYWEVDSFYNLQKIETRAPDTIPEKSLDHQNTNAPKHLRQMGFARRL